MWEALRVTTRVRDLEPVGLSQRFLAALIDSGMGVGVLGGLGALALERGRPDVLERLRRAGATPKRLGDWTSSPRARRGQLVLGVVWAVAMRNARSPGMRAAHVRRVDARTGGPVTVRSALTRVAFQRAWKAGTRRVTQPVFDRWRAGATQSAESGRTQTDDPRAEAEFAASQRAHVAGCCGTVVAMTAIQELPMAFTSRRQNLTEWVAGIVVVRD